MAFLLKKDLAGPGVSLCDVIRATEAVVPALEIVDSRIRDWKVKINASSARFVLSGRLTRLDGLDLSLTGLVFRKNGVILGTAAVAPVAGDYFEACFDRLGSVHVRFAD